MTYRVDPDSETPPARQLVETVLDELSCGRMAAGQKLPSVRKMATEALVNPNTVGKAYKELEAINVVVGRNGSGVFVREDGPAIASAMRREKTLCVLFEAAEAAMRAGHQASEISEALSEYLSVQGLRSETR